MILNVNLIGQISHVMYLFPQPYPWYTAT